MVDLPGFGTLDLTNFTVGAMLRTGIAIRRAIRGATSLEEAADTLTRYLYDHCVTADTGKRSCALVRFYTTHRLSGLEPELQRYAERQLGDIPRDNDMRCLTLLGTAGEEAAWNSRQGSRHHQAIPLPSADIVRQAPMIARLIGDLGLDIDALLRGDASRRPAEQRTYDVFYVKEAAGSPHIPAQREFVHRYNIASVVGFGGLLRSGELFAVILFSHVHIPPESAARFRTIALDVRSAMFGIDETTTWRT